MRLLVLDDVVALAEILPTHVASKRLRARVNELVLLLRAEVAERAAASGARVRLLPGVDPLVALEILHVAKVLGAHIALKGPLACVNSLVAAQRRGKGKDFVTLVTGEGLLPGVDAEVFHQRALLEETLAAEFALERKFCYQRKILLCAIVGQCRAENKMKNC